MFSLVCSIVDGTPRVSAADEIRYFAVDELPAYTVPKQIERMKDALASAGLILKTQRGPHSLDLLREGF